MKFSDIFKYNRYCYFKSSLPPEHARTPAHRQPAALQRNATAPQLTAPPPEYTFERPVSTSSPPAYSETALISLGDVTRVEIKVDIGTGNLPDHRSTHRWSERINLGTEIIVIHNNYTLADIHRHMIGLFSAAIEATVRGPRDARYFVYWEPTYRQKPHRLAITPGNWSLVMDLLFTKGAHLGEDFARRCWIEVHVSTAEERALVRRL